MSLVWVSRFGHSTVHSGILCAQLPDLVRLDLFGSHLTDLGVVELSRLGKLAELELSGCRITDKGCQYLARIVQLTSLGLAQNFAGE